MIGVIISAIIVGLIVGALGRLVVPGRQNLSIWLTIAIGIVAALSAASSPSALGVGDTNGIDWIKLLIQVALAAVGVALVVGRRPLAHPALRPASEPPVPGQREARPPCTARRSTQHRSTTADGAVGSRRSHRPVGVAIWAACAGYRPVASSVLPAGNPAGSLPVPRPAGTAAAPVGSRRSTGDEPLQAQPARPRVHPVRVARPRPGARAPAPSRRSTARRPARCWPRSPASPPRTSPPPCSTPTATLRSSTPPRTRVRLPESFRRSYQAYVDAEFWRADVPVELGGTPIPPSLRWAIAELVLGSNPGVHMYSSGFSVRQGRAHARDRPSRSAWPGTWSRSTGAPPWCSPSPTPARTSAPAGPRPCSRPTAPGTSPGVKRFITVGRQRHAGQHRPPRAGPPARARGPGTKGLSLFVVPQYHVDLETGALGERNGVFVTNVEHKMGLKVSTTCELRFGEVDGIPAVGTLARRRARRHRPDVQDHRGCPHDGRHQGDRHPVDRLPQRPGVRQGARPGRRPRADGRQDAPRASPSPTTPTSGAR